MWDCTERSIPGSLIIHTGKKRKGKWFFLRRAELGFSTSPPQLLRAPNNPKIPFSKKTYLEKVVLPTQHQRNEFFGHERKNLPTTNASKEPHPRVGTQFPFFELLSPFSSQKYPGKHHPAQAHPVSINQILPLRRKIVFPAFVPALTAVLWIKLPGFPILHQLLLGEKIINKPKAGHKSANHLQRGSERFVRS